MLLYAVIVIFSILQMKVKIQGEHFFFKHIGILPYRNNLDTDSNQMKERKEKISYAVAF